MTILSLQLSGILGCCGMCTPLALNAAQLRFEQPQVEVALPIDAQEANVVFHFKNTSLFAVRILEVRTECDCMQALVPPREVEAGKTGEVTVKFRAKLRNGTDMVRAKVVTDSDEIYEISVSAKLRSYIEVRPGMLQWKKGEKREAKEFIVSSTGLGKLHFSKVTSVKASGVALCRGQDPATIRVHVTPPAGDGPFQDVLLVTAVIEESGETRVYDLHLRGE